METTFDTTRPRASFWPPEISAPTRRWSTSCARSWSTPTLCTTRKPRSAWAATAAASKWRSGPERSWSHGHCQRWAVSNSNQRRQGRRESCGWIRITSATRPKRSATAFTASSPLANQEKSPVFSIRITWSICNTSPPHTAQFSSITKVWPPMTAQRCRQLWTPRPSLSLST